MFFDILEKETGSTLRFQNHYLPLPCSLSSPFPLPPPSFLIFRHQDVGRNIIFRKSLCKNIPRQPDPQETKSFKIREGPET